MDEPMIHTGDNYGMDGKVNLPNFTEDVDWKGLEDLYSVNESLYGYRNKYRLSPDNWANYLKDVDRVFALLNNIPKKVTANSTVVVRTYVSSNASALIEMSSADSEDEFSGVAAEEREPKMEVNLSTVIFNHKKKLENNLPKEKQKNQAHWSYSKTERQRDQVSLDTYDVDFSGNGLTELESKRNLDMQTFSLTPREIQQRRFVSEDIFQDQMYLPIDFLAPQAKNISTVDHLDESEDHKSTKARPTKDFSGETDTNLDMEGSASFSLSSD